MEEFLSEEKGNLCRCTGYRPILDGFKPFTKDYCAMGEQCCKRTSDAGKNTKHEAAAPQSLYDPSQEPIFPSELQLSSVLDDQQVVFRSGSVTWYRPCSVRQLLRLRAQYPGAKVVAGNTTLGLERLHQDKHPAVLLCVSGLSEITKITITDSGIKFGAAVSLAVMEEFLVEELSRNVKGFKYRSFRALKSMLEDFAALQIKNMVTIGGCVASAWANSDVVPLLCALGATLHIGSHNKPETAETLTQDYFKGPGQTLLKDPQTILAITLPFSTQDEYVYSIKQSRRDFDTALVSTAAVVTYDKIKDEITDCVIYPGNILPSVFSAKNLSNGLIGKQSTPDLVSDALTLLQTDFTHIQTTHSLTADVRSLTEASVWKLLMQLLVDVKGGSCVPNDLQTSLTPLAKGHIQGTRIYEEVPEGQSEHDTVGRPVIHRASRQQATGEAQYIDDIPCYQNELHLSLVTSTQGHARVLDIDVSEALKVAGVVDVITRKDVPGTNSYGIGIQDEVIFAQDKVEFYGQIIAAVLATSHDVAWRAAKLVHVTYEPLPCITTIQEAMAAESYFGGMRELRIGDMDAGFSAAETVIQGELEVHGQEHFYMETVSALAVPLKEDHEITLYLPVQNTHYAQSAVAEALDIPRNRVCIKVKRAGGGFGGKETKLLVLLPVALAAFRQKRPVRCVIDRGLDMQITGGRNPILAKYKIGVKKTGELTAVAVDYYANAGSTTDASPAVLEAIMSCFESCYRVPNAHLRSRTCKTNLPSNTAVRAFGQPQSIYITETWIQHVAEALELDPIQVREKNMYRVGDLFPLNCSSDTYTTDRCWTEVMQQSHYFDNLKAIVAFNSENKYRKRGIHIGPMKFGLQIPVPYLNQGHALVNLYLDGTVLVHHGGVELGQGLHTKIIQVASRELGRPISDIYIKETNTDVIHNNTTTGGSSTTDLCAAAVMDACEKLMKRLLPYREANKTGKWVDWVNAAYRDQVSLSATGFYKQDTPELGYNWETGKGVGFSYYSCGAACSQVEVDILTGQHTVTRVDIVMDVGRSLNPAIDIGQIEGAFLMGYGLYCLEELNFDGNGRLKTSNAMGYKIPVVSNVPKEFNISLLKGSSNPKAIYSSKGIGEPPLLLAHTAAMAVRQAVAAYRHDIGKSGYFRVDSPITPDKVRALCPR